MVNIKKSKFIYCCKLKKMKAELKTISLSTTALIHDGFHYKKKIYLTSIDGKILITEDNKKKTIEKS